MKHLVVKLVFCSMLFTISTAFAGDNQLMLDMIHKYGITKCDNFILENSALEGLDNWQFYINKHQNGIDGPTTEVTIVRMFGSKGDSVKYQDTYIQTPKNCYVNTELTVTYSGSCESTVNGDFWYVSTEMPNLDYTTYTNKGGVDMYAKEISMGNFNACIQETSLRKSGKHN